MASSSKPSHADCASRKPAGLKGFTLLELLVVISILILVMALAAPAVNSVMRGSQISQAGQAVNDQLSLARQTALSKNHAVEVRFYEFVDSEMPGEQAATTGTGHLRALQSFEMLDSGTAVAVGKMQRIQPSIIIDSGGTLSSLIDPALKKTFSPTSGDPQVSLPRVGSYYCYAFRFLPDGSTSLSPTAVNQWFLTLHNINDGDSLATPPKNFITLQIDPTNGHIRTYRP